MVDIDTTYCIGPDEDAERNYIEDRDEAGDACQHWDNRREERRISNR